MSLCRNQLQKIPNPVNICQQVYGIENVNDVRDCIINSIRRFYGFMCPFHEKNLYHIIQLYLVKVLEDAGKNPKAVKLPMSPAVIEGNFFVNNYIQSNFNAKKAYELCLQESEQLSSKGLREKYKLNCTIDYKSVEK